MKTIRIKDEVYRKLQAIKREDESLNELLERLVEGSDPLEMLRGLRGYVEFTDKERMLSEISAARAERRA